MSINFCVNSKIQIHRLQSVKKNKRNNLLTTEFHSRLEPSLKSVKDAFHHGCWASFVTSGRSIIATLLAATLQTPKLHRTSFIWCKFIESNVSFQRP